MTLISQCLNRHRNSLTFLWIRHQCFGLLLILLLSSSNLFSWFHCRYIKTGESLKHRNVKYVCFYYRSIWFQTSTSAKKGPTIAVLMRFVITPKDPTTAHVNQDMKGTEIIAQVISFVTWSFCMPSKALLFLFFHDKVIFIAIF